MAVSEWVSTVGSGVRDAGPLGGPHVRSIVMEHAAGSMSLHHVLHGSRRRAPVSVAMARVSGHVATHEDASHDHLVDPRRTPNQRSSRQSRYRWNRSEPCYWFCYWFCYWIPRIQGLRKVTRWTGTPS